MSEIDNIAPQPKSNPLLQRIQMPGETFALPSGGVFYTNGELDSSVQNAEVRVHPMTALDEIYMQTPDMLFSGDAIRKIFNRCIPQVNNVDMLLAKDVDFLLVCLRKVSYGDDYQIDYKHTCEKAETHSYTIDVTDFIRRSKKIDPTTITKEFTVVLPNDQKVKVQPIRYKNFVEVMQISGMDDDIEPEELNKRMLDSLANIIVQVDECNDKDMIREWLDNIRPQYIKHINNHINNIVQWGPDFVVTLQCKDCGEKIDVTTPLNPLYFFT